MKKYASMIVLAPLVFAVGCGGGRPIAKLSGKVTMEGKPFEYGIVKVVSEDEKAQGSGEIQKGGEYTVANAPIGKVRIMIIVNAVSPPGQAGGADLKDESAKGGALGGLVGADKGKMPDKAQGKGGGDGKSAEELKETYARYLTTRGFDPKYSQLKSSDTAKGTDLTATVESGGTVHNIELSKAKIVN